MKSIFVFIIVIGFLGIIKVIFKKPLIKLNFGCIISDYLNTFYKYDNEKEKDKLEIFLMFILPIILGIFLGNFFIITKDFINTLLTIFSILLGLMLNLLVLILDKKSKKEEVNKLSKEVFYSISFSILISILIVISSLIFSLNYKIINFYLDYILLKKIASAWTYSLIFLFCLDLFLILKRIHILLDYFNNEIKNDD